MNSIASFLSDQTIPVFGYRINVGQSLVTTLVLAAITTYAIKKIWSSSAHRPMLLSEEAFWKKVEEVPLLLERTNPLL